MIYAELKDCVHKKHLRLSYACHIHDYFILLKIISVCISFGDLNEQMYH